MRGRVLSLMLLAAGPALAEQGDPAQRRTVDDVLASVAVLAVSAQCAPTDTEKGQLSTMLRNHVGELHLITTDPWVKGYLEGRLQELTARVAKAVERDRDHECGTAERLLNSLLLARQRGG